MSQRCSRSKIALGRHGLLRKIFSVCSLADQCTGVIRTIVRLPGQNAIGNLLHGQVWGDSVLVKQYVRAFFRRCSSFCTCSQSALPVVVIPPFATACRVATDICVVATACMRTFMADYAAQPVELSVRELECLACLHCMQELRGAFPAHEMKHQNNWRVDDNSSVVWYVAV